ncbi:MAG: hypothetical protein Q9170_000173 [Blastenia crenularia]
MSTEAPTDQPLVDGELAEDVMDISGSEDEDALIDIDPVSGVDATPPTAESDSEETYEPPLTFEATEKDSRTAANLQQQHPDNKQGSEELALDCRPLAPPAESNATSEVQDVVEPLPKSLEHASSCTDANDSDDYEPPEPTTSVDVAIVSHDAAAATSESSFSPPDANEDAEAEPTSPDLLAVENEQATTGLAEVATSEGRKASNIAELIRSQGYFTAYESPLQRFRAYRYHPDFVSRASNAPDDLILVQMGAVPEGLSAEQKDAFVVGLRQVIQEIRGRKVKDFRTVASEIAAYRARFLGDNSKVLPL